MKNNIILESRFTHPENKAEITVHVAVDVVAAHNSRRRKFNSEKEVGDFRAIAVWAGNRQFALFFKLEELTHNIISHEINHVAKYILEWMDIKPARKRIDKKIKDTLLEPEAYLTGYLTEKVYKILKKHGLEVK